MNRYDSIVIGAGHNGLVCAAYLAKAGQKVLVLESGESPGGLAASREFHAGFRAPVAHSVNHFSERISRDLALESHGFKMSEELPRTVGLSRDGKHVVVKKSSVAGVSAKDADAYGDFYRLMHRFAETLQPFWLKTIPRVTLGSMADLVTFGHLGLKLRLMGRADLREFMRIAALPARDLMDEYFDSDLLKSILCWDALIGSKMAPRSPNHAVLPMLYRMAGEHRGNPGSLIAALQASASASGVEIRTGAAVARILVHADQDGLAARGVELVDGDSIEADRVVSSADPHTTFFRLAGIENLEIEFTNRIRRLRCEGYVAKLHLALDALPEFTGLDQPGGRLLIAPHMDAIEFAFDDAKYGAVSTQPVMEVVIPSLHDESLAPPGQHVLSANVMYVPYGLKSGWDDAAREALRDLAIDAIAPYAPGIRQQILHAELLTPADIERAYNVTGGHWHHTEFALDQSLMMRPTYEAAQYRTPLPNLWLCGAGSHPGGDLTGAPGHNAARAILK
ncbi:MAG: NAD(P)/FAD-dependent oxidoreductase [Gammaproteobacteria bacterium]|nr:NAD(P)/FAD-dependent oxidoreductase [Gammaproteobacteria bacterium]